MDPTHDWRYNNRTYHIAKCERCGIFSNNTKAQEKCPYANGEVEKHVVSG